MTIYHFRIYLLLTSIVILVIAVPILRKNPIEMRYTRPLMGTLVEIALIGDDEKVLKEAADTAFSEMERLEAMISHYRGDSELSMVNRMAGGGWVKVSPELLDVIGASLRFSELSRGAFDVTMGVLGKVWDFSNTALGERPPPPLEAVKELLPLVDYRQIVVDREKSSVRLNKAGMRINLGGIAKGYIVGKAVEVIKARGVKRGIIHAGGDMFVFQDSSGPPFKIGIQHPRNRGK
ncbi:MAG: FAD:protein FMN transferase, partial [Deltaproteobacteria bacterium]|nr:FAD:protein FMN transferase [Deltaproteobacteria bacterium]